MLDYSLQKLRGIGLLELMLVILVIASILFMGARYYRVARRNMQIAHASEMILNITNAAYKWVEGEKDFSALTHAGGIKTLVIAGLLPSYYASYAGHHPNPWLGDIYVEGYKKGVKLLVTFTDVPVSPDCTLLKKKMEKYSKDSLCVDNSFQIKFDKP